MKKKLVAGVIGAGNISPYHIRGYLEAGVEIEAIVDIIIERAEEKAEKYGIPKVFTDYKKMLQECPELDVVSICTPNYLHAEMTIEGLKAGKHVLCEKPPAINAEQATKMKETAEKTGKILMYDFNNRARPDTQELMKHIKRGEIGRINSAQAWMTRRRGIPGFGDWFTQKAQAGGGPVVDLLHMMDLALYFMDYPEPKWVLAQTFTDFSDNPDFKGPWGFADVEGGIVDVEMASHAFVTFKTGQVLFARNSWAEMNKHDEDATVAFQGTKAGGRVTALTRFSVPIQTSTTMYECEIVTIEHGHPVNKEIIFDVDPAMGRLRSVMNFVNVVRGTAKPLNNPEQAVILMKIIDALYESAETKKPVKIE